MKSTKFDNFITHAEFFIYIMIPLTSFIFIIAFLPYRYSLHPNHSLPTLPFNLFNSLVILSITSIFSILGAYKLLYNKNANKIELITENMSNIQDNTLAKKNIIRYIVKLKSSKEIKFRVVLRHREIFAVYRNDKRILLNKIPEGVLVTRGNEKCLFSKTGELIEFSKGKHKQKFIPVKEPIVQKNKTRHLLNKKEINTKQSTKTNISFSTKSYGKINGMNKDEPLIERY